MYLIAFYGKLRKPKPFFILLTSEQIVQPNMLRTRAHINFLVLRAGYHKHCTVLHLETSESAGRIRGIVNILWCRDN